MLASRRASVRSVVAALAGEFEADTDWRSLLATANRCWLAPAVYSSLSRAGRLHQLPPAVREYLDFLHGRNLDRNLRLRAQLTEAVRALNGAGIEPVLLKGTIPTFTASDADLGDRMTSDLDLSIDPADDRKAREALRALGYVPTERKNEMGRAKDVGTIELHGAPNSRSARFLSGNLLSRSARVAHDGASAWVPCNSARALHLIVHDMIKDGDYWRFRFDLRHLRDLAELTESASGIDWQDLELELGPDVGLRALEVQAVAIHDLFGVEVPPHLCTRRAKNRHRARLAAAENGLRGAMILAFGRLSWGAHRLAGEYRWAGLRDFGARVHRILTAPERGARA